MIGAVLAGFFTGLTLILAIGAQNAFVLRQGIRGEHVMAVVAVCALSDAALIAAGVAGFGAAVQRLPWLGPVMLYAGAGFLLVYGALRFRAAARGGEALRPVGAEAASLRAVVASCLLFTWANPHVYLDTLVLIGGVSAQYAPHEAVFGGGAMAASGVFFASLGYGARLLAPVFARPGALVVLEIAMGLVMWVLAAVLVLRG